MAVTFKIDGLPEIMQGLNDEIKRIEGRTQKGVSKAALFVKAESMDRTPVKTGNLRDSHRVETYVSPEGPAAQVQNTAAYSLAVHENLNARFSAGSGKGGAKFLERALNENRDRVLEIITENAEV